MKLPPLALTAPSLCPRCDAPALSQEECAQCALPLRRCGSCFGVAGPFDRYCGFCGHELVLGGKESAARRLWPLAGLVPILAALAIGLSPLGQAAVRGVTGGSPSPPAAHPNLTDRALGFTATAPAGWSYTSYASQGVGIIGAGSPKDWPGMALGAGSGPVVELGRPSIHAPGVDPNDPVAVLAADTAGLLAAPPAGFTLATISPVHAISVNGRRGAEALLSAVDAGGGTSVYERVYLVSPAGGLFLFQAVTSPADLPRVRSILSSLRLTR